MQVNFRSRNLGNNSEDYYDSYYDSEDSIISSEQFVSRLEDCVDNCNVNDLHNLITKYTSQQNGIINLEYHSTLINTFIDALYTLIEADKVKYIKSVLSILHSQIFLHLFDQRVTRGSQDCRSNYELIRYIYDEVEPNIQLLRLCQHQLNQIQVMPNNEIALNFKTLYNGISSSINWSYDYKACPLNICQYDFNSYQQSYGQIIRLKTTQPYSCLEEYLNNNFYIIREEFLASLRPAICSLQQTKFDRIDGPSISQVNLYYRVKIIDFLNGKNGIEFELEFEQYSQSTKPVQKINWSQTKKIKFGSLVILTTYEMYPLVFCIIQDRKVDQKNYNKNFKIQATFVLIDPEQNLHNMNQLFNSHQMPYMIEYPQLYEPTLNYLTSIQNADIQKYPFQKYLIQGQNQWSYPKYSNQSQIYKIDLEGRNYYEPTRVQIYQHWPRLNSSLDTSQIEAIKCMLRNRIALIQGPPGTGKTYCGALCVRVLLENLQKHTPIVIVCQTNHALDQFLLKLLNYVQPSDMVRLGNQSKVEQLQQMSLRNHQKSYTPIEFNWKLYHSTKNKLETLLENIMGRTSITYRSTSVYWQSLTEQVVERYLNINQIRSSQRLSSKSEEMIFYAWINFNNPNSKDLLDRVIKQELIEDNRLSFIFQESQVPHEPSESQESQRSETSHISQESPRSHESRESQRSIVSKESQRSYQSKIIIGESQESQEPSESEESVQELIQEYEAVYIDSDEEDNFEQQQYNQNEEEEEEEEEEINHIQRRIIRVRINQSTNKQYNQEAIKQLRQYIREDGDPWLLSRNEVDEISAYCYCIQYQQDIIDFREEFMLFKELKQEKKQQYILNDVELLQNIKIVGVTVSGVAGNIKLLNESKFKIMIIEEAAEVLEAHLAAILHPNIEHLILIGDHKQLRPKVQSYDLERKYQCNISMFERFILMNMDYVTLQHQRRMKTQFADFIRIIYGNTYQDHEDIYTSRNIIPIKGMSTSLLYFDYREQEVRDINSSSTCNPFEAKMIANFVNYLIQIGYQQCQINVISMYAKQVIEITKILTSFSISNVKVKTVDNFQGEENDIIIVSLVRSNTQNKIGFLINMNRINVALSRAKLGLFVFGNFQNIKIAAQRFNNTHFLVKIINLANQKQILHDFIPIACLPHQNIRNVTTIKDWDTFPPGTCGQKCELQLICKHSCQRICHLDDHKRKDCTIVCGKQLKCKHTCEQQCHILKCECNKLVKKQLKCGHKTIMLCYSSRQTYICFAPCRCGHQCGNLCHQQCHCQVVIDKTLDCGHVKKMKCSDSIECIEACERTLNCGHKCKQSCKDDCSAFVCDQLVMTKMKCGHSLERLCSTDPKLMICQKQSLRTLPCGHQLNLDCKLKLDLINCLEKILITLSCGHDYSISCSERGIIVPKCMKPCQRPLQCEHKCTQLCWETCRSCQVPKQCKYPDCKHIITIPCGSYPTFTSPCKAVCNKIRNCGHISQCTNPCSSACSPCNTLIDKLLRCGHTKEVRCCNKDQPIFGYVCRSLCFKNQNTTLPCGHLSQCVKRCGEPCSNCIIDVDITLQCGHELKVQCYNRQKVNRCKTILTETLKCGHSIEFNCYDSNKVRKCQQCGKCALF